MTTRQTLLNCWKSGGTKGNKPEVARDGTSPPLIDLPGGISDEELFALFPDYNPSDGECEVCLKKGHRCGTCPYMDCFPKGADLADGCDIICRACGHLLRGSCCGLDEGRVIFKHCSICSTFADHWPKDCPKKNPHPPGVAPMWKNIS